MQVGIYLGGYTRRYFGPRLEYGTISNLIVLVEKNIREADA